MREGRKATTIFITTAKVCSWGSRPGKCASCRSAFEPDIVYEDGKPINYWVSATWSHPHYEADWDFCWGCASLFLAGNYRGAANDYEVDLEEFGNTLRRVAEKEKWEAYNPQESQNPAAAVRIMDHRIEMARMLETACVVDKQTFDRESRIDRF